VALLRNDALINNPALRTYPTTPEQWRQFILSLNNQEVESIVVAVNGFIRSGQTAYDTGTGWWIGDDGGTPKFSIGDSSGQKLTWNGTNLVVVGGIGGSVYTSASTLDSLEPAEADANETETRRSLSDLGDTLSLASPTWTGFLAAPSGGINYALSEDGRWAEIWMPADRFGTSNDNGMSITNLPVSIQPIGASFSSCIGSGIARDNNVTDQLCGAKIWQASHASAGVIEFTRYVSGSFNAGGWTNSVSKGLPHGMRFRWPL
jgi:hypothetical protein